MLKTPLEDWIAAKIGVGRGNLTKESLVRYQFEYIRRTLRLVKSKSSFYRELLKDINPDAVNDCRHFSGLPFTYPEDLRADAPSFVCVGQSEIERIVSLQSSGTSGQAKRIYFTGDDQELTVDFFDYGMRNLVDSGDRVMILLPWELPSSVGDLLRAGLRRFKAAPLLFGPVYNAGQALDYAAGNDATSLVGIPTHVLAMARHPKGSLLRGKIKSVLLSTDYVPRAICRTLENIWGCRVFNHYGMTEMGLGGGVQCQALAGYHLREADLYFEIIDPQTGSLLPEGEFGEIVFTTLTRTGLPLIRYRTGDLSRFLPGGCPCGTVLRSMDMVRNRIDELICVGGVTFSLPDIDEKLFSLEGVLDYQVKFVDGNPVKELFFDIKTAANCREMDEAALQAILAVPALAKFYPHLLRIFISLNSGQFAISKGTSKRKIIRNASTS